MGWAIKAIEALRKIRRSFRQEGDIIWRLEAEIRSFRRSCFIKFIQKKKLVKLPITNKDLLIIVYLFETVGEKKGEQQMYL